LIDLTAFVEELSDGHETVMSDPLIPVTLGLPRDTLVAADVVINVRAGSGEVCR